MLKSISLLLQNSGSLLEKVSSEPETSRGTLVYEKTYLERGWVVMLEMS